MLAAAYTLRQNEHIRIDIVYGAFSRRVQHWIDLFGHVFFLMPFVILMIVYFIPYVGLSYRSRRGVDQRRRPDPLARQGRCCLIGFVLLALQGISEIIKKIAIMRGDMDDPTPFISVHEQAELEAKALAAEVRT